MRTQGTRGGDGERKTDGRGGDRPPSCPRPPPDRGAEQLGPVGTSCGGPAASSPPGPRVPALPPNSGTATHVATLDKGDSVEATKGRDRQGPLQPDVQGRRVGPGAMGKAGWRRRRWQGGDKVQGLPYINCPFSSARETMACRLGYIESTGTRETQAIKTCPLRRAVAQGPSNWEACAREDGALWVACHFRSCR